MLCSLIGQAPALVLSKLRDTRAYDCTVSVFLDLSDSMKDMVKNMDWTSQKQLGTKCLSDYIS